MNEAVEQAQLNAAGRYYEAATQALIVEQCRLDEVTRPSFLYRPALSIDGDKWCALYGLNLQDGVAGFGDSPDEAYRDFDKQWNEELPKRAMGAGKKG